MLEYVCMTQAVLSLVIMIKTNLYTQVSVSSTSISPRMAVETIVKYLKSDDSELKCYAIEALSKTAETRLIPLLKKYLNDQDKYVVISTAKALWNLGDTSGLKKLYQIVEETPDVDQTKNDPLSQLKIISTNKIREKALSTIADLEGIKSRNLLIRVKENDNFGSMRDAAARELAKIGYRNEIETFYSALLSDDEEIRNQAAENLAKICPQETSKIIEALKKEKSLRVQMMLIDSLRCSRFLRKDEEDLILSFISSKNQTLKIKAITALSASSNPKTLDKLQKIYYDTTDILTKLIVLRKLSEGKRFTISCDDIDYLNSIDNPEIKRRFIEISDISFNCSKKYLEKYITDSDPYVSIDASVKIIEMMRKK
ncbi:MAG: HEAT repeat domain-containing protein [Elusimicrobiales bacterium]